MCPRVWSEIPASGLNILMRLPAKLPYTGLSPILSHQHRACFSLAERASVASSFSHGNKWYLISEGSHCEIHYRISSLNCETTGYHSNNSVITHACICWHRF